MIEKTANIQKRFDELTEMVSNPEIISDQKEWKKLMKERASLEELISARQDLIKLNKELENIHKTLEKEHDQEMIDLFKEEEKICKEKNTEAEENLKILLLPKDENDDNNVIMEIRAGVGGDESALFATELLNMYRRFSERNNWRVEMNDVSESELGGIKECSLTIIGKGAFAKLKYESGVHRVQRVPETEAQGRIHTSTATIAVLPEIEDIDFEILDKDLKVDTYRSSGAGGQKVNKTDSAVRMTHLPTGIIVACQDERSQFKNRDKALNILKSKLYDFYKTQRDKEYAENRKNQIGSAERCERIRTYNYPQGRITDHRINYTVYSLESFLDGDIIDLVENLAIADRKAKLEAALKN